YLTLGSLPPGWQVAIRAHGDRVQRPGKERLVLNGTITRNQTASAPFQIIHELPNQVRYQEGSGAKAGTIVFDGGQFAKSSGSLQKDDGDLIETLAYDTPESFFFAPGNGQGVRN